MDGLVAELAPAYRVAAFQQRGIEPSVARRGVHDRRGAGRRGGRARPPRLGPAYVLGFSWGGHLAFWVAAALPGRLLGVLSVDPLGAVGDGGNAAFEAEMAARTPAADRTGPPSWTGWRRRATPPRSWRWRACGCSGRRTSPIPRRRRRCPSRCGCRYRRTPGCSATWSRGCPSWRRRCRRSPCRSASWSATGARCPPRPGGTAPSGSRGPGPRSSREPVTCTWHERPGAVRQALDRLVAHSSASSA